jgi:hypothetical protein
MKNIAAKLFLATLAVTGLSAAAMATTVSSANAVDTSTSASSDQRITSIIDYGTGAPVFTLDGGKPGGAMNCYMEWTDPNGAKRRLRIQCPKWQK